MSDADEPLRMLKWDRRYLEMADLVSTWSKDPSSKIGAVVIGRHGQVLSTGYNGFPRGVMDSESRLQDRDTKLTFTIHAEMNAIFNASLTGVSLAGSTMYVSGLPTCSECAKGVAQSGINTLVFRNSDLSKSERWAESWKTSSKILSEAGVTVILVGTDT